MSSLSETDLVRKETMRSLRKADPEHIMRRSFPYIRMFHRPIRNYRTDFD